MGAFFSIHTAMKRKLISVLVVIAVVVTLTAVIPYASAAQYKGETVYFTVINDTLLNLDFATMPASIDGRIYIPYTVFTANFYLRASYSASDQILLMTSPDKVLKFDLSEGVAYDKNNNVVRQSARLYRGQVFVPADFVANYFSLSYYLISDASIVRLTSEAVEIPDAFLPRQLSSQMDQMLKNLLASETTTARPPAATSRTTAPVSSSTSQSSSTSETSASETSETSETETTSASFAPPHVIFSFLAPDTSEIGELLDWLEKNHITACIYTDGTDPDVTAAITSAGHTLGALLIPPTSAIYYTPPEDDLIALADRVNSRFYRTVRHTAHLVWSRYVSEDDITALSDSGYDTTSYVLAYDSGLCIAQNALTSSEEDINLLIPEATVQAASIVLRAVRTSGAVVSAP